MSDEYKPMHAKEAIIIKEGFLMKRGHMRHNWKTRWFKLSDTSLRYYKSKCDTVPQGRIPLTRAKLSMYQCDQKSEKHREFVMQISTCDGTIYPIQAPSSEELKIWMQFIKDIIEHLDLQEETHLTTHLPDSFMKSDLSRSEILGSYIDAYGDIKTEERCIGEEERHEAFSGLALRVWLEHSLGIMDTKAKKMVRELLNAKRLSAIDDILDSDVFSEETYYIVTDKTKTLKEVVEMQLPHNPSAKANQHNVDMGEYLPTEILIASDSAVLPSDLPPGDIVRRGILFKKGHIVHNWKARCFILQKSPATLSYFDPSKKNPRLLNSLPLRGALVYCADDSEGAPGSKGREHMSNLFWVETSIGTSYLIMASSSLERYEWMEDIESLCTKINSPNKSQT